MAKLNILLPLYNDWRSCNFLIKKINAQLKKKKRYANILILNDFSSQRINISNKDRKNIKKIQVLTTNKNLGSQKIISVGLDYIRNKKNEIIIVMDSDGEDDVLQLNKLIDVAIKKTSFIIVASRVRRRENFIFKILYKFHLIFTFFLTFNWISFGNYSSFHSKNIKNILKNNDSWSAYSSCILNNCQIIKIDAERKKRFYDKSKLSFFGLFKHSFRILSVFQKRVFFTSFFYSLIILMLTKLDVIKLYSYKLIFLIIFINLIILITKRNTYSDFIKIKKKYIKKIVQVK